MLNFGRCNLQSTPSLLAGDEIEVNEFQNKCVVFVSSTEKFIPPQSSNGAGTSWQLHIVFVSAMSFLLSSIPTAAQRAVGPYYVGSRVGSGGFGDVYLGKHKVTNDKLALKFMPVSVLSFCLWLVICISNLSFWNGGMMSMPRTKPTSATLSLLYVD